MTVTGRIATNARRAGEPASRLTYRNFRKFEIGAGAPTRTGDLLITNQLLYQLSYTGLQIADC